MMSMVRYSNRIVDDANVAYAHTRTSLGEAAVQLRLLSLRNQRQSLFKGAAYNSIQR
jgi:hypothetical protein